MSDSRACKIHLLTWLDVDFLSEDVESRDDKSCSMSEPPFARVQQRRISAGYFVFFPQGRDLSSGTRSTIHRKDAERMVANRIGLACPLGISSARYFIRLYIVVLLTRRSATSVTERVSRDTRHKERQKRRRRSTDVRRNVVPRRVQSAGYRFNEPSNALISARAGN